MGHPREYSPWVHPPDLLKNGSHKNPILDERDDFPYMNGWFFMVWCLIGTFWGVQMTSSQEVWLPVPSMVTFGWFYGKCNNVGKYASQMDPIGFGGFKWANRQSTKILYKVSSYDRDKWSYKLVWGGLEPQLPIYFRPFIGVITPFDTSRGPSCRSRVLFTLTGIAYAHT